MRGAAMCSVCRSKEFLKQRGAIIMALKQVTVNKGFLKQKTRKGVPPPPPFVIQQTSWGSRGEAYNLAGGVWRGLEEFKGSRKILGVLSIQKSLLNFSCAVVWPALLRYQVSAGSTGNESESFIFVVIVCFVTFYVSA